MIRSQFRPGNVLNWSGCRLRALNSASFLGLPGDWWWYIANSALDMVGTWVMAFVAICWFCASICICFLIWLIFAGSWCVRVLSARVLGGSKSHLMLGGLGDSLLTLLVGVNLTLVALFKVILLVDIHDWYNPLIVFFLAFITTFPL